MVLKKKQGYRVNSLNYNVLLIIVLIISEQHKQVVRLGRCPDSHSAQRALRPSCAVLCRADKRNYSDVKLCASPICSRSTIDICIYGITRHQNWPFLPAAHSFNHGFDAFAGERWRLWHTDDRACGQFCGRGSAVECSVQCHKSDSCHKYTLGLFAE